MSCEVGGGQVRSGWSGGYKWVWEVHVFVEV